MPNLPRVATQSQWEDLASRVQSKVSTSDLLDLVYPVGSYYATNSSNFSPSATFGGSWILCAKAVDQPAYTWRRTA